ncbi:hypothetical protein ICA_02800 [Bacillus cereus BAG1O-3]|uniref:hypothetical protein n=1 Tax=Bacillus cereus group TaxID=86661 RepID=UPI00035362FC|nr:MULTISPECIES: hypothetical protein [Bacillus cereus group]EPF11113.1 hypothetical protein ICA_02800 [Bacillus cereus BAG1O-3]MDR4413737.1 hypothetical protein [Bacillus thuringiensis]HDR8062563.1 hypothetical protein [Bacillus cereus]
MSEMNHKIFEDDGFGEGEVILSDEMDRGINYNIGASILANLDNLLKKYLRLNNLHIGVQGKLNLQGQVQTPLDLYEEAGLAIRLQAVAEISAVAALTFELKTQELLEQLQQKPELQGFPAQLCEVFLEESTLKGGIFGKASLSLMAYANLVLTGRLFQKKSEQDKPKFHLEYELGFGFIAGGGYRIFLEIEFDHVRRLIGRMSTQIVNDSIKQLERQLTESEAGLKPTLSSLSMPIKLAFRSAYELGLFLTSEDEEDPEEMTQRCVQLIFEEAQYWMLEYIAKIGFSKLIELTSNQTLIDLLKNIPNEAFCYTDKTISYWEQVFQAASTETQAEFLNILAKTWSAVQLSLFVSSSLFGEEPFRFPNPPASIRGQLNELNIDGLLKHLLNQEVDEWLIQSEEVKIFLSIFQPTLGASPTQVIKVLLTSLQEIPEIDAQSLVQGLQLYIGKVVDEQLTTILNRSETTYIREIVLPALRMAFDVSFVEMCQWNNSEFEKKEMREALSTVLMNLIGKTLLHTTDTLTVKVQENLQALLSQAAEKLGTNEKLKDAMIKTADTLIKFETERHQRILNLLLQVINPLPATDTREFALSLKNRKMMPKSKEIEGAALEVLQDLYEKLETHIKKMMKSLADILLDLARQFLGELENQIRNWVQGLLNALQQLTEQLQRLLATLQQLTEQIAELRDRFRSGIEDASRSLLDGGLHNDISNQVVNLFIEQAFNILGGMGLPRQIKDYVRDRLSGPATSLAEGIINSMLLDPLRQLTFNADEMLDSLRGHSVEEFEDILMNRMLEQIEGQIRELIGDRNPGGDISIHVRIRPLINTTVNLGRIEVPIPSLLSVVRSAINSRNILQQPVHQIAELAQELFAKENEERDTTLQIADAEERKRTQESIVAQTQAPNLDVLILSPVANEIYEGEIPVQIQVLGVSRSFLGEGDNSKRLTVWINRTELSLSTFAVTEDGGTLTLSRNLSTQETQSGINVLLTAALDGHGNRKEQQTPFGFVPPTT